MIKINKQQQNQKYVIYNQQFSSMSILQQNNTTTQIINPKQQHQKNISIKRTKKHEAILKIKEVTEHIDIMKKRHQRLQVIDDQHCSKTIQHQRKIQQYQKTRELIKKDRQQAQRINRLRMYEAEVIKQKNQIFKDSRLKKITQTLQKFQTQKVESYLNMKQQQQKNQDIIIKHNQNDLKQKQEIRKSINQMQQISKVNISRYKQKKQKQTNQYKSIEFDTLMETALKKQKQLEKLSKKEQQMIKKNSQSMQISQVMRNKLRQILGDQRRFTMLPEINKNKSTRGSTGNSHIIAL